MLRKKSRVYSAKSGLVLPAAAAVRLALADVEHDVGAVRQVGGQPLVAVDELHLGFFWDSRTDRTPYICVCKL